jgi:hypothetical protein
MAWAACYTLQVTVCLGAVPADVTATNLQLNGASAAPAFVFGIPSGFAGDVSIHSNRTMAISGANVSLALASSSRSLYLNNRILKPTRTRARP